MRLEVLSVPSGSTFREYPGVRASETNFTILPNRRYQLTYDYRTTNLDLRPQTNLDRSGGQAFGDNSATELYSFINIGPSPFQFVVPSVNTWHEVSFEFTTPPDGTSVVNHILAFSAFGEFGLFVNDEPEVGSAMDFDNVRLEELEVFKVAELFIGSSSTTTFSYSNTGVLITFIDGADSQTHTVELVEEAPDNTGSATFLPKHWIIDPVSGTFSAVPEFSVTQAELTAAGLDWSEITLVRRSGPGNPWIVVPSTADSGTETIAPNDPVDSFSEWAISNADAPEPTSAQSWQLYQ